MRTAVVLFTVVPAPVPVVPPSGQHFDTHVGVESSAPALELAESNARLNGWQPSQYSFLKDDISKYMQQQISEGASWDMVLLDPPKLAPNRKSLNRAMIKYRKLNTMVS